MKHIRSRTRFLFGLNIVGLAALLLAGSPRTSAAQDRLCDVSFEDCREPLLDLIRNETVGIDVAFWFMEDSRYTTELIRRKNAGVRVRVLMDLKANPTYPLNATRLSELRNGGIPMRQHLTNNILHWKMMLFVGQNTVEFSASNYSGSGFVYEVPYSDYIDEVIYFSQRESVVNSFKTKFDDSWTNTTTFSDYANMTGPPTRAYPIFTQDPELNFPPAQSFRDRSVQRYNAETQGIDSIMYRITDQNHTNALIAAHARGVQVRLITEPDQYRDPTRLWHSWNVDRLYMAGIEIRHRAHLGLTHQKSTVLHGQRMTIFGSSNWTSPSNNQQEEHNYFTTRSDFYTYFVDQFERKWFNLTGVAETKPFVPLPPDPPINKTPGNGTTGLGTSVTLVWDPGYFAHGYDIYLGTTTNPPLLVAGLALGQPPGLKQYVVNGLNPGTKYYWRVLSRTMANKTALGSVWSFTTAGSGPPPPPPPPSGTVLLADNFTSTTLDSTKWLAGNLFTGTEDPAIPLSLDGATLVIGPLLSGATGSHYYGVRSRNSFSFSGVSAHVQLVERPSPAVEAYAMFAVGKSNYYYRWYVDRGVLVAEKRAVSKTTLTSLPYSATNHQYLRIRHDSGTGSVVFETAPDAGGSPGTWTARFSQPWDPAIPLTGVMIELKGGTSSPQTSPGRVRWDNVNVVRP